MKLRIRGNTLRYRLTRTELETLRQEGKISEIIEFPQHPPFTYSLRVSASEPALSASFAEGEICVFIPEPLFQRWLDPQEVGISGVQTWANDKAVSLLIEKDFPCLTPRTGEDDSDAFARPE